MTTSSSNQNNWEMRFKASKARRTKACLTCWSSRSMTGPRTTRLLCTINCRLPLTNSNIHQSQLHKLASHKTTHTFSSDIATVKARARKDLNYLLMWKIEKYCLWSHPKSNLNLQGQTATPFLFLRRTRQLMSAIAQAKQGILFIRSESTIKTKS